MFVSLLYGLVVHEMPAATLVPTQASATHPATSDLLAAFWFNVVYLSALEAGSIDEQLQRWSAKGKTRPTETTTHSPIAKLYSCIGAILA